MGKVVERCLVGAGRGGFLILDAGAGGFFWVYGATQESPEQRASKRLTHRQLANTIIRIQRLIADLDPASRSASLQERVETP
ncbi:MAG: hypothetical protein ACRDT0_04720 [Pseudonocardiaceae bacterium]